MDGSSLGTHSSPAVKEPGERAAACPSPRSSTGQAYEGGGGEKGDPHPLPLLKLLWPQEPLGVGAHRCSGTLPPPAPGSSPKAREVCLQHENPRCCRAEPMSGGGHNPGPLPQRQWSGPAGIPACVSEQVLEGTGHTCPGGVPSDCRQKLGHPIEAMRP